MKKQLLCACFFAAALLLKGDNDPTLDVFAGWAWSPYPYCGYPRHHGCGPYWPAYPVAGLGLPLNRWETADAFPPYGYYGYAPFWGYEYGVRIHLKDSRHMPALSEDLLQPFPGSAPTELQDLQREKKWDQDIDLLLGTLETGARQTTAVTNTPPRNSP